MCTSTHYLCEYFDCPFPRNDAVFVSCKPIGKSQNWTNPEPCKVKNERVIQLCAGHTDITNKAFDWIFGGNKDPDFVQATCDALNNYEEILDKSIEERKHITEGFYKDPKSTLRLRFVEGGANAARVMPDIHYVVHFNYLPCTDSCCA